MGRRTIKQDTCGQFIYYHYNFKNEHVEAAFSICSNLLSHRTLTSTRSNHLLSWRVPHL